MAVTVNDPTTKRANFLSSLAHLLAVLGIVGLLIGLFTSGPLFFAGLIFLTTGLLMKTMQSCTMLIIREMWEIERSRRDR